MIEYFNLPYHQPAFLHLGKIFEDNVRYVLSRRFAEFRGQQLLARFQTGKVLHGDDTWNQVREILDIIDSEMQKIVSRRSVAYWLHLYRRIGVFLSPEHEDKTDHVTLALVRQIAELAIQKHGVRTALGEFGLSNALSPDVILGGWMKKGLKGLGSKETSGENLFRKYAALLRRSPPNWVIRDFSKRDFIDIYAIEGAAYQYWRLTALLRSLGKGAKMIVDEAGDWAYVPNETLNRLIFSIDKTNEKRNSFSSLMGVWIDSEKIIMPDNNGDTNENLNTVFFPIYNTQRVALSAKFDIFDTQISGRSTTNFIPLYMNSKVFFDHHRFMREEFLKKRGYDFELLINVLAGLSSLSILPNRALFSDNAADQKRIKLAAFTQTLARGYHIFIGSETDLLRILIERMSLSHSRDFDEEQVRNVLSSITLSEEVQGKISPWSNGPRSVVIPAETFCLVDLVSVPALLASIFVFMADRFGESGTTFETLFREALKRRGHKVHSGKLVAHDGSERELDAGVLVGDQMHLFECVAIERPLDYEIGRPKTLAGRQHRLSQKLDQANSLKAFVSNNPAGRNYDFSRATKFVSAVVSPFVEWIWDTGPNLWMDRDTPRILSPEEAFLHLGSKEN